MLYHLVWLFFLYSVAGWVLAALLFVAIRRRRYVDRGVLNGPLCVIYGIAGVIIAVTMPEIRDNLFFLFLYSGPVRHRHRVDRRAYSGTCHRYPLVGLQPPAFNFDGYVALPVSAVWGFLGVAMVRWVNPLLVDLIDLIPQPVGLGIQIAAEVVLVIDAVDTVLTLANVQNRLPRVEQMGNRLSALTLKLGLWLLGRTERRMVKANPRASFARTKKAKPTVFAQGCSFYKIVMLFFIGSFLGDIVETILLPTSPPGYWMSRSVWCGDPFPSCGGWPWRWPHGFLYRYKDRSSTFLFVVGTLVGGAYEYLCSVFTEIVFGTVFWDYSAIPFNLAGRVNLLYCFFWGIAAVVWFRVFYPVLSRWIEKIPLRPGKVITWCLLVFMAANVLVSSAALSRYTRPCVRRARHRCGGSLPGTPTMTTPAWLPSIPRPSIPTSRQ